MRKRIKIIDNEKHPNLKYPFLSLVSTAQKPWVKLKIDSAKFSSLYGTELQYQYQKNLNEKSTHKMLCLFSGAQYMYMYDLAYYLGMNDYNVSFDDQIDKVIIEADAKSGNKKNPGKIKAVAKLNKYAQITSLTITGPADDLIKLYVYYWELTPISLNQLKTKKQIVKEFVSDLVAIRWTEANPVITVTKNNNAAVDLFPMKK